MTSTAALRRAVLSLSLLVVLLAGLAPAAVADEPSEPAEATTAPEAPSTDAGEPEAAPTAPAAPADPVPAPTDGPTDAPTEQGRAGDDVPDEAVEDRREDADDSADDVQEAVDVRASERAAGADALGADADGADAEGADTEGAGTEGAEADDADVEAADAEAAAPAPQDIQVVEIDAEGFCEVLSDIAGDLEDVNLGQLNDQTGVQATPGTVLPDVDSAAYRGLLEAVDTVLAGYPGAYLVAATYDGTSLVVTVVPDITQCEGLEDVPLPQPADDLGDVEVVVTVITEEDICAALEEVEDAPTPPTGGGAGGDLNEQIADLIDSRGGDELAPDELDDLTGLGIELDAVLADNPDSSIVSASYDGATLAIVLAPDPTTPPECEEPVEATPIADTDDTDDTDDGPQVLAATGLDTPRQAALGGGAVLLGAVLVALGRSRYRGAHVSR